MSNKSAVIPKGMESFHEQLHFSPAVRSGDRLYCSGQIGTAADGSLSDQPEAQFAQAFENLGSVLSEAGCGFDDLLELTTFHVGFRSQIATFMSVKDRFVRPPYPAWTAIGVSELAFGALVEIKAVARIGH